MENSVDIPETGNPAQGKILYEFNVTPERVRDALELITSSVNKFDSQRQDWVTKNIMNDRAYRAILEPPKEQVPNDTQFNQTQGRAYVGYDDKASPIIHDNVETIKARLKESILPINKNYVDLESDQINEDLLEYRADQLNKQLDLQDIQKKLDVIAHNATVYGTFYIDVPFVNDRNTVLTRQTVNKQVPIIDNEGNPVISPEGMPMIQTIQSLETIEEVDIKYFGPGYEPVKDVEDVYLDMFIEDIQDQPIVIRKYVVDYPHLRQGIEAGIYFEDAVMKIKDKCASEDGSTRSEQVLQTSNIGTFNMGTNSQASPKEYEMYKAYCDFEVTENDNEGKSIKTVHKMVISVIENEVIQMMPNPYFHQMIPIIKGCYRNLPGEAYGLSSIDPVLGMYHEYNDTMNQVSDSKILSLNPIKIVAARSSTDKRDLDIYPGVEWVEKNPGDIRFAQFDFSTVANGLQYLEILELKINKGMGVTRLLQGSGDQTDLDQTATGVNKVIEQADKKFRMIAKRIEDASIRQWAEMAYKINTQFDPLPVNGTFREINSETNYVVKGVDNFFDNLEETNRLIQFTQQSASIPGFNLIGFLLQIAENLNINIDQKYGPMFTQPPAPEPEEKPMNVSVTMPVDMTKGTMPAMAAAQILAQKGIKLDLDSIGQAAAVITEMTPENIKEESGILPQESKKSVHTTRTRGTTQNKETTTEINVGT